MNTEPGSAKSRRRPDYEVSTRKTAQTRLTDIGLGVKLPLPVEVRAEYPDRTATVTVSLVAGRLACTSIEVSGGPGVAITGEMLRAVPVAELTVVAGARGLLSLLDDPGEGGFEPPEGFPSSGPTPEALRFIATVYSFAHVIGQPPTKAVESLGLTYPTAARWVALARAAGYLGQTEPGRAGGKGMTVEGE